MGRTGDMFAWQGYGIKPDIMTCAKAIGCGVPVGAFFMTEEVAKNSLEPGDHGTTYGGNPFVSAAICEVLRQFEKKNLLEHVKDVSEYLEDQLDTLVCEYDFLVERRGKGLMQGVETTLKVGEVSKKALENGLIVITAGKNVLRFVPPLIITEENVDEMICKLKETLDTFA